VEQNYTEAIRLFRLSAVTRGIVDAQNGLGSCYEDGLGVDQDYAEAVHWYSLAASQGKASAQHNLALCYENGQGVEQD